MILVDTDIFIDYFREHEYAEIFFDAHVNEICITYFTMMELIAGAANKVQMKKIQDNLFYPVLEANSQIMQLSVKIYIRHRLTNGTGLIDSINAASAIHHNLDFTNPVDFKKQYFKQAA